VVVAQTRISDDISQAALNQQKVLATKDVSDGRFHPLHSSSGIGPGRTGERMQLYC